MSVLKEYRASLPEALAQVARGGVVVCAGIHMTDIPSFPYRLLWQERIIRSVANRDLAATRSSSSAIAPQVPGAHPASRSIRWPTPAGRSTTCARGASAALRS